MLTVKNRKHRSLSPWYKCFVAIFKTRPWIHLETSYNCTKPTNSWAPFLFIYKNINNLNLICSLFFLPAWLNSMTSSWYRISIHDKSAWHWADTGWKLCSRHPALVPGAVFWLCSMCVVCARSTMCLLYYPEFICKAQAQGMHSEPKWNPSTLTQWD